MITITNNNIFHSDISLTSLSSLDNVKVLEPENIVNFLSDNLELGESVTFKRLFEIISHNFSEFTEIFYSSMGGYPLEPYLQEIENIPTDKIESNFLEVHWFCDRFEDELTISPSIHGINIESGDTYALDFVSLNNLKNLNVKLNESVEIFDYTKIQKDDEGKITNLEESRMFLGFKSFTVFELYHSILYEITFHGGPQDKQERLSDIENSIEEIDEDDDEVKTFEDIIEKIESQDKYLVKYKQYRDRIEEDRIQNPENLENLKNCLLEKLKIIDSIVECAEDNELYKYYKKLTDIEYNMQTLYGEPEDIMFHKFWETPKCTCPKIDNIEIYPSKSPIFDKDCPIHTKK